MQPVAGGPGRLAGAGPGVGAFEDDAELVTGQHRVPVEVGEVAGRAGAIVLDELGPGREAVPGRHPDRAGGGTLVGPGGHQPTQVEQWITDGRQFPVNDGRKLRAVIAEQHVRQVKVAVENAGLEARRPMGLQPGRDDVDTRDGRRPWPFGELGVAVQLAAPARDLAFEVALGLAEVGQADRDVVNRAQGRDALDHGQTHAVAHGRIAGMIGRQFGRRVEAVDRFHQIEGRADQRLVRTGGDQPRMRHVRPSQGSQHPRLAPHRLIGVGPQVPRRAAQDIGPAVAFEAQQQVLRPASQRHCVDDRPRAEALSVHPGFQDGQIDHPGPGGVLLCGAAHQAEADGRAPTRANQAFTQAASSGSGWPTCAPKARKVNSRMSARLNRSPQTN